jgi:hypothetical protein
MEKLKRQENQLFAPYALIARASPRSGLSATHGRKLHSALFKVSLHDCVIGNVCG